MTSLSVAAATVRALIEQWRAAVEAWLWGATDVKMAAAGITVTRTGPWHLGREYSGHGGTRRVQMWTETDEAASRGPLGTFRVVR